MGNLRIHFFLKTKTFRKQRVNVEKTEMGTLGDYIHSVAKYQNMKDGPLETLKKSTRGLCF